MKYKWEKIMKYKTVQVVKSYSKFKDDIITNLHILKEHNGKYYVIDRTGQGKLAENEIEFINTFLKEEVLNDERDI